jgi:hypothetical protein
MLVKIPAPISHHNMVEVVKQTTATIGELL